MFLFAHARLVRLSDGAIIWLDKGSGTYSLDDFNNFSELEKNNFKLLDKYYKMAVYDLFNNKDVYFFIFKELFPKKKSTDSEH